MNAARDCRGARSRIALARAFLKNPPLLILDEAEASLDRDTATLIRDRLAELPRDTTVLLIAHRLESAAAADRILVMRDGRIVEAGSHAELLTLAGDYATMTDLYHEPTA